LVDWAAAGAGGGGQLVAADLLVFIRMLIFYNGRFFDAQSIAHDVLQAIQTWRA
jgi:hypothetical protein